MILDITGMELRSSILDAHLSAGRIWEYGNMFSRGICSDFDFLDGFWVSSKIYTKGNSLFHLQFNLSEMPQVLI